jgi:L-fuconolactonase
MIVDACHHVWDLTAADQPWLAQPELAPLRRNFALSDLKPEAVAQDVMATVLVQTVTEPGEAARSLTADLSQAEHSAVFRDTAVRAYGLKPTR